MACKTGRHDIAAHSTFIRELHKLPVVLTAKLVARLLNAAPRLKHKEALRVAYGAGLHAAKIISFKTFGADKIARPR